MLNTLDRYELFKGMEENLLKGVRQDIAKGLTADQIYEKYEHLAAACAVTLLARSDSPKELIPVIREIRDRVSGRAVEKKEVRHKFDSLTDDELKALVASEMTENSDIIDK